MKASTSLISLATIVLCACGGEASLGSFDGGSNPSSGSASSTTGATGSGTSGSGTAGATGSGTTGSGTTGSGTTGSNTSGSSTSSASTSTTGSTSSSTDGAGGSIGSTVGAGGAGGAGGKVPVTTGAGGAGGKTTGTGGAGGSTTTDAGTNLCDQKCDPGTHCEIQKVNCLVPPCPALGVATCVPDKTTCGGFIAKACPGAGTCVDDPSDTCDPKAGGADCGGVCECTALAKCQAGMIWDARPWVCACVAQP